MSNPERGIFINEPLGYMVGDIYKDEKGYILAVMRDMRVTDASGVSDD